MSAARRFWALMAVLATIALTSFTVQAILDTDMAEAKLEGVVITGNVAAEDLQDGGEGFSELIEKAADWLMEG